MRVTLRANDPRKKGMKPIRLSLMALLLSLSAGAVGADSVEIITSPDRAGIAMSRPLLRSIFTMRLREWPDGRPVRVFVLPDSSEMHDQFCREQLGIYPYVLRGVWDRMVFTGTGFEPVMVKSEQEMREKVRATPGAIGYLSRASKSELNPAAESARNGKERAQ